MSERFQDIRERLGIPRLIIIGFVLLLFVTAYATGMSIGPLVSASLVRIGMNGILVLAMVPTITAGVGLNFGLSVGILCGLVGSLISMELRIRGFSGFFAAILFSMPLAVVAGWAYAKLLNKVKGQEMMVGTYVGFSMVALMCIFWLAAPFSSPEMVWAYGGQGLRYTLTLDNYFGKVLNNFLLVSIGQWSSRWVCSVSLACCACWCTCFSERSWVWQSRRQCQSAFCRSVWDRPRSDPHHGCYYVYGFRRYRYHSLCAELRISSALHGASDDGIPSYSCHSDRRSKPQRCPHTTCAVGNSPLSDPADHCTAGLVG